MLIDQLEEAIDELLALEVAHLAEGDLAAEMVVAVRVAARAPQRAFPGDLDGQRRSIALEYPTPGGEDSLHAATISPEIGASSLYLIGNSFSA